MAQKDSSDVSLKVLPLAFYSPDTKFGGGAAGIVSFKLDTASLKTSSVTFGLAYTQLKQTLCYAPFNLFTKNDEYWLYGELGYYDYIFNFFGTGNDIDPEFIEKYDARFPRIRLNALKKVGGNLYLGLSYLYDNFEIRNYRNDAILLQGDVTGWNGGVFSGIGINANYDSRNHVFYPTEGILLRTNLSLESDRIGSDFNYQKLELDFAKYFEVGENGVLALNAVSVKTIGDTPFQQMAFLGGTKRLRGYFEGKYRDKNMFMLQSEFRYFFTKRLGAVAFAGAGEVYDDFSALSTEHIRPNAGAGIRFALDPVRKINVRLDYGIGYKSSGFYLTVNEAF